MVDGCVVDPDPPNLNPSATPLTHQVVVLNRPGQPILDHDADLQARQAGAV